MSLSLPFGHLVRRVVFGSLLAGGLAIASCGTGGENPGGGGDAGSATQGAAGSTGIAGSGPAGKGGGAAGSAGGPGVAGSPGTAGSSGQPGVAGKGGATGAAGMTGLAGSAAAGAAGAAGAPGRGGTPASGGAGPAGSTGSGGAGPSPGACKPPIGYRNLFRELLGKAQQDTDAKAAAAFQSLFHGGSNATVYYESGTDEAYILDVNNNDVRTEGLSYGMMIAVQLDKKTEFNRLWKWTKSHHQQSNGYFAWQTTTSGQIISSYSAPDGEEYFAPALIFASKRWGDGTGIYNYANEARLLLDALAKNGNFNKTNHLVTFGSSGTSATYTDGSYVLPAFYEVWACFDTANAQFWKEAVTAARAFFPKACNATTALAPDLSNFDGSPYNGSFFKSDAYRVVANIMMDHNFYALDPWQPMFATKYAAFFKAHPTGTQFQLSGQANDSAVSTALKSQNAMVAFALPADDGKPFVQALWDLPIPTGQYRYYDGMLYLLAYLHVSGNFRLYF